MRALLADRLGSDRLCRMDRERNALLARTLGYQGQQALWEEAVQEGVTVDDVVTAGLGRPGATARALRAAQKADAKMPGLFASLSTWPLTCPFCKTDVLQLSAECLLCLRKGCPACVRPSGCPFCQDEQLEKLKRAELERVEREALLRRLGTLRSSRKPPPRIKVGELSRAESHDQMNRTRRLCRAARALSPVAEVRISATLDHVDWFVCSVRVGDVIVVQTEAVPLDEALLRATEHIEALSTRLSAALRHSERPTPPEPWVTRPGALPPKRG